ncbi:hypothetical protein [Paenibacillus sp. R14(2021)]|uniref:hypothetical protein n=1 Tax=Paenibacillus sp. R14(2021) TaxID=2859228 RepID=UPI001C612BFF|nr:hypothetical protein [Paenibacillus sp. R14(2021)]
MIVHYTRDIQSASGMLSSKELLLSRIGSLDSQNDILHYLKEFNRLHYMQDLISTFQQALVMISTMPGVNQQQFFMHTLTAAQLRKQAYQAGVSLEGSLSRVLKQNSYVASFTEEVAASFPSTACGEIAFVFDGNPLRAPRGFELLFNKVHYADAEKVDRLQAAGGDNLAKFMESISQEPGMSYAGILAAYIKRLEKQQQAYAGIIHEIIDELSSKDQTDAYTPLDYKSHEGAVDAIHSRIVEEYTTLFRQETGQKPLTKNEIKQRLKDHPEMAESTWLSIRSVLVKDEAFKAENEVRAVLLPQSKEQFNQTKKQLPVGFDTGLLKKIVISPSCESKAEWKAALEEALRANKYNDVVVE